MTELPAASTAQLPSGFSPKELLAIRLYRLKLLAIRYWWLVGLTICIGLAIQGYRWTLEIPHYSSSARMMVSGQLNITQGTNYSEEYANFYGTQVALMRSQETVNDAITHVRAMNPDVEVDPNAGVGASQEPRTSIFNLQVVATNPKYAQLLLDAVMESYLAKKRGRRTSTTDEVVTALTEKMNHVEDEIKADSKAMLDFQKDNNVVFIEQQTTNAANSLVGLNNEMAMLTKERDLLAMNAASHANPATNPENDPSSNSSDILAQEAQIERLKILRDDLGTYLKDQHPKIIALTDVINQDEKYLVQLKTNHTKAQEDHFMDLELKIKNLEKQIFEWNQKSLDMNQRLTFYQQLKNKMSREENMYDQWAASFQTLGLNQSIDLTDVSVMDKASPGALIPVSLPSRLVYGLIFGLLAGCAMVYFINRLEEGKVDSPFGLEEHISVPIIGQIPLTSKGKKSRSLPLISPDDDRHSLVESFRDLRSFILFSGSDYRPKSLLICSAEPNEGKSTVVANLAIAFAATGLKVLLIDADLRRGVLHDLFGMPSNPGLSEYLQRHSAWQHVVRNTQVPTLDLMPRGSVPHYPGELLLSEATDLLIQETGETYDIVLWDSAPLLAADDASNLCPKVDSILFVVRCRVSSIRSVRAALEIIANRSAKLLGLVLNAVEPKQPGYYDKYRYKDYYGPVAKG